MKITFSLLSLLFLVCFCAGAQEQFNPGSPRTLKTITHEFKGYAPSQRIEVEVVDDMVVFQGDIVLFRDGSTAAGLPGTDHRWPDGRIPYVIQSGHPQKEVILTAISRINNNSALCLFPRFRQDDYVEFIAGNGCWSYLGRCGGRQEISIATGGCHGGVGGVQHEILHAAGFFHEQSSSDRDEKVRINFDNILEGEAHNFRKVDNTINICRYDFESVMHYPPWAFSKNGEPTIEPIEPLPPGVVMGETAQLSFCDIQGITRLYPAAQGCAAPAPLDFDLAVTKISNVTRTSFRVEIKNVGRNLMTKDDIKIASYVFGKKGIEKPGYLQEPTDERIFEYPTLDWTGTEFLPAGTTAGMTCTFSQPSPLPMFYGLIVKVIAPIDQGTGNNSKLHKF